MSRDKDIIRPTDAEAIALARRLLRTARHGALAVIEPDTGAPAASRVSVATDVDGTPIILVSTLSGHTAGLVADPRCSLLVGEPGRGDPLAHPRLSISCLAERVAREGPDQARVARRFLNRHPKAELYAGFADFSYFLLRVDRAGLNGGFGKAYRLEASDILLEAEASAAMAEAEQAAIEQMNADHAEAVELCARHFGKARAGAWRVIGIDAEGLDLMLGDEACRIVFSAPVGLPRHLLGILAEMAAQSRSALDLK
jgi:heme iron utilization protein